MHNRGIYWMNQYCDICDYLGISAISIEIDNPLMVKVESMKAYIEEMQVKIDTMKKQLAFYAGDLQ